MRILLLAQKLYADFFQRTSPKKTPPPIQVLHANESAQFFCGAF